MNSTDPLERVISGAKMLLGHLADADGPEITALKDRVSHAVIDVRQMLDKRAERAGVSVRDLAVSVNDYVRDYPWLAVASAAAIAATAAFLAGTAVGRRK